jgi:hypothetical protein
MSPAVMVFWALFNFAFTCFCLMQARENFRIARRNLANAESNKALAAKHLDALRATDPGAH